MTLICFYFPFKHTAKVHLFFENSKSESKKNIFHIGISGYRCVCDPCGRTNTIPKFIVGARLALDFFILRNPFRCILFRVALQCWVSLCVRPLRSHKYHPEIYCRGEACPRLFYSTQSFSLYFFRQPLGLPLQ